MKLVPLSDRVVLQQCEPPMRTKWAEAARSGVRQSQDFGAKEARKQW